MILKNKNAVVTGCNKGIGKKILETFSANGASIFACVRTVDDKFKTFVEELSKKDKSEIIPIELDLNNGEQVKTAANKINSSKKNIDILVNNAAAIHTALFQMTSVKKLKEIFETNLFSQTNFTQYILKSMIKFAVNNINS